jgi:hypothetical protein
MNAPQSLLALVLSPPVNGLLCCGAIAVGVTLLLWGRWSGRALFLLAGAWAGWWGGTALAARLGVNPLAAGITLAALAGFLSLLLTPLLWAMVAGALVAGAACYFAILNHQPDLAAKAPVFAQMGGDIGAYFSALWDHLAKQIGVAWERDGMRLGIIAGLAGGVPFLIGSLRLRLSTIIVSSLCGGAAVMAGLGCLAGLVFPAVAPVLSKNWFVLGGAGAALAAVGVLVQYRRAIKTEKDQDHREGEPPPKTPPDAPAK